MNGSGLPRRRIGAAARPERHGGWRPGAGGTRIQVPVDLPRTRAAIQQVADEIAGMLQGASDTRKQLPRSDWTVGEAAAHLAIAQEGLADIARELIPNPYSSLSDFAPINAQLLESFSERDGALLAGLIVSRTAGFLENIGELPGDMPVPTPMGIMDPQILHVYDLAHLLMHGHPLARALGRPSPVTRERALLAVPFLHSVLPKVFDKESAPQKAGRIEVRLRGGPSFVIVFDEERCGVETFPNGAVDCHISADPVAFFLVSAGVVGQWGPIAAGKMVAWGRKPWIAFRLKAMLPNP